MLTPTGDRLAAVPEAPLLPARPRPLPPAPEDRTTMAGDPTPPLPDLDVHAVLRACHERRLEREGIPMFLALIDERRDERVDGSGAKRPDGRAGARSPEPAATATALADLAEDYAERLLPSRRREDEFALVTVLQVLAYAHFAPHQVPR